MILPVTDFNFVHNLWVNRGYPITIRTNMALSYFLTHMYVRHCYLWKGWEVSIPIYNGSCQPPFSCCNNCCFHSCCDFFGSDGCRFSGSSCGGFDDVTKGCNPSFIRLSSIRNIPSGRTISDRERDQPGVIIDAKEIHINLFLVIYMALPSVRIYKKLQERERS